MERQSNSFAIYGLQIAFRFADVYEKVNQHCKTQAIVIHLLLAGGTVTMPRSPPPPAVVSNPGQAHPNQPKLACTVFLKTHFEHGGIDKKGHDMLYRMIEMMSAIGWEVHIIRQSKIVRPSASATLGRYMTCILQGCNVFNVNMNAAVEKAFRAANTLPKLQGASSDELDTMLTQWRWKLR